MITGGLLRNDDFRRLWIGDALSQFGSRVGVLVVPLLAIETLHATAFEVSLLRMLDTLAYLLLGLQVGAWCDRLRIRPLLIAADVGRALILLSIPLAAAFGALTLAQLLVAVFAVGVLTVVFDIAHQTYLPRLVSRDDLLEGNARLQTNLSVAAVAGPSSGGFLFQLTGGPGSLLVTAFGFLWSAAWLRRIQRPEPRPQAVKRRLRTEIAEGLKLVFADRLLRAMGIASAVISLFQSIHLALVVVFLRREIGLSPAAIGLLSTTTLLGALAGAMTARRVSAKLSEVETLRLGYFAFGVVSAFFPLTMPGWGLISYVIAGFGGSYLVIVTNVVAVSLQQSITPERLRGRVNATIKFLLFGAAPIGSLLGGIIASGFGTRVALSVAAAGLFANGVWYLVSLRHHALSPSKTTMDGPVPPA
ncbi:Predicted arabinose efflux permease, MFS family [Amycolatopsis xylanica]|uniref:Predicted arabinose efflux permease, MFS family n=1 Tax=Amycolatopsis xylanica TaxID=589385 RepID=A0A1H3T3Q0_9PSEU|nr:MFS transporter [Amycolatopsis xylanica]SDZ44824.1 Predicted arabinose efflux permease, MFS family [Amycolatopsis xylanica]